MPVDQLHRGPLSRGLRTSARLLIGGVHLGEIGLWQTSSSIGVLRAYRRHHRVRLFHSPSRLPRHYRNHHRAIVISVVVVVIGLVLFVSIVMVLVVES